MPSASTLTRNPRRILLGALVALLAFGAAPTTAQADPPHRGGHRGSYHDVRHGHDRYYPRHGHRVYSVPRGYRSVRHHHDLYYYYGGAWYLPRGGYFVVGSAPIGAYIGWLPRYHTTIWVGGLPYYYANDTYYAWDAPRRGYVVVDEPRGADEAVTGPSEPFVYPNRGQSEQKQADDRYACHAWAVKQTSYDPSLPPPPEQRERVGQLRSDYFRAMSACLEGRGYTVR